MYVEAVTASYAAYFLPLTLLSLLTLSLGYFGISSIVLKLSSMCRALCCAGNYLLVTLQQQQPQQQEEQLQEDEQSLQLHQVTPTMGLKRMFGFGEMQSEEPELSQEQKEGKC